MAIISILTIVGILGLILGSWAILYMNKFIRSEHAFPISKKLRSVVLLMGLIIGVLSWPGTFFMGYPLSAGGETVRVVGIPFMAADNAVALDGVIATMMGLDPARLRFLQKAKAMGLGDFDPAKIKIHGELKVISDFKLPPLDGDAIAGNTVIQEFIKSRASVMPHANPDLCTECMGDL